MSQYALTQLVPPTSTPFSVSQLTTYLKASSWETQDVTDVMNAAVDFIQASTNRQLCLATWQVSLPGFPLWEIELPRFPLVSVTWVKYYDVDGVLQTLDPALYQVSTAGLKGRVAPAFQQTWPETTTEALDPVTIKFVCGESVVSDRAKQAVRLLAGHFYTYRSVAIDRAIAEIPLGLRALIRSLGMGGVS